MYACMLVLSCPVLSCPVLEAARRQLEPRLEPRLETRLETSLSQKVRRGRGDARQDLRGQGAEHLGATTPQAVGEKSTTNASGAWEETTPLLPPPGFPVQAPECPPPAHGEVGGMDVDQVDSERTWEVLPDVPFSAAHVFATRSFWLSHAHANARAHSHSHAHAHAHAHANLHAHAHA